MSLVVSGKCVCVCVSKSFFITLLLYLSLSPFLSYSRTHSLPASSYYNHSLSHSFNSTISLHVICPSLSLLLSWLHTDTHSLSLTVCFSLILSCHLLSHSLFVSFCLYLYLILSSLPLPSTLLISFYKCVFSIFILSVSLSLFQLCSFHLFDISFVQSLPVLNSSILVSCSL